MSIIDKYSNTKAGSLAKYYAGICYLNTGDYKNAITVLDDYDSSDKLLLSIAKTAIGDAFSELNQSEEAIEYYKKAINIENNQLTTPIVLMKCAKLYELENDYDNALKCYKTIKSDYPESTMSKNIDKYINNMKYR